MQPENKRMLLLNNMQKFLPISMFLSMVISRVTTSCHKLDTNNNIRITKLVFPFDCEQVSIF